MAEIDVSRHIGDLLRSLPSGHPDRRRLQAFYRSLMDESSKSDKGVRFSPETKSRLKEIGYLIYTLPGFSVSQLVLSGKPFAVENRERWIDKEFTTAIYNKVEVAIHRAGFLKSTFGKGLDEQERITEYELKSGHNRQGINRIRVIIGTPAQYAQIIFTHYEKTGQDLLADFPLEKRSSSCCLAGPLSKMGRSASFVLVYSYSAAKVSFIPGISQDSSYGHPDVGVIPLIVPENY